MLVFEVLVKYHKVLPFPWSTAKIKKAGLNPTEFLLQVGKEIGQCEDANTPTTTEVLDLLKELDVLGWPASRPEKGTNHK